MTTPRSSEPPADDAGESASDNRLPQRQAPSAADSVIIKFSSDGLVLELEGDDVDLGTDLKVRHEHRLVAEFRRDAVDGWWFKSSVLQPPHRIAGLGDGERG